MTKIVYNKCHGGFGLSEAGMRRYAELKGITLYVEADPKFPHLNTYWTAPPNERHGILSDDKFYAASIEARKHSNARHSALTLSDSDIMRFDPFLVQVVEDLGEVANGKYANLAIADIPAGTKYRIDEYDGLESVMTIDDYEWFIA